MRFRIEQNIKKRAFQIVYKELIKMPLFVGRYDAANGNPHFMYGVQTVMEYIAMRISDEQYEKNNRLWANNMEKSRKARSK